MNPRGLPSIILVALACLAPLTGAAGERELWALWQQHQAKPDEHATLVEACRAYAAAAPQDPLLPVVHGLEAWHRLRAGQAAAAVDLLTPLLARAETSVDQAAQRLARGWLTLWQRERVVDALQHYYRKEVRYPANLRQLAAYPGLPDTPPVPWEDAWAKPWRYRLTGFAGLEGFADQRYALASGSLPPPADLAAAVALPYGERIQVQAERVAGTAGASVTMVKLQFTGGPKQGQLAIGQPGVELEGLTIAHAGPGLVIVCDALHWNVMTWKQ